MTTVEMTAAGLIHTTPSHKLMPKIDFASQPQNVFAGSDIKT